MSHNSIARTRWDLLIIILALYNCVIIPLNVAFTNLNFGSSIGAQVIDRIIDVLFFLDVVLNFRTTFLNPTTGIIVKQPKRIAYNYIFKGRFVVDVLATIPFELIFQPLFGDNSTTLKFLGILKLLRLLRLGRIITFLKLN